MRTTILSLVALALAASASAQQAPVDVAAVFAEADRNGDGVIDHAEFQDRMAEIFYLRADRDKDGSIDRSEAEVLVFPLDVGKADRNANGRVEMREFVAARFHDFEAADTNHDEVLTIEEVQATYANQGEGQVTRSTALLVAAAALVAAGCPSAYDRAYEAETQKLQAQAGAENQRQEALHAEASRYAAVVYFDTGSAVVGPDGQRELRWFAQQMQPYPQAVILVQGFTDAVGREANNKALSDQRAQAVADVLAGLGIAPARLQTSGFATESPAATNATAKGRTSNRRVEVTVR